MQNFLDLTIAVPVKNEEKNLPSCLEAIGKDFARNIVIIDSDSIDRTKEIAKQYGAEVIDFKWNGKFPKKRNWFLRNYKIQTSWIMFLDADEFLTKKFKDELRNKLLDKDIVGYWLSYTIFFLDKELKGGYPLKKLALFRVGAGEYERIEEENWSQLDMEIHEHPILKGRVGQISNKINHRDFHGISHYINKLNEYAKWEAYRYLRLDDKSFDQMTLNQKVKYKFLNSVWIAPLYFIGSYIFLGGFRDGARGFVFAVFKMSYFNEVHCRIKELKDSLSYSKNQQVKKLHLDNNKINKESKVNDTCTSL